MKLLGSWLGDSRELYLLLHVICFLSFMLGDMGEENTQELKQHVYRTGSAFGKKGKMPNKTCYYQLHS